MRSSACSNQDAREQARRADAELANQDRGPLHGIPVSLEDMATQRHLD
jgi:Asp-tRNA(Asn)/Glu-tRNA(Gln) amidotransferase A subunit family amidase